MPYTSPMDKLAIQKLNKINKQFYKKVGIYFHTSREYSWKGWEELLPLFSISLEKNKFLDVGCGNGRFGLFLQENLQGFNPQNYTGVDFDEFLLEKAKISLPKAEFLKKDIVKNITVKSPKSLFTQYRSKYDFIFLFGVLHHIPSFEKRQELLVELKALLAPSGKIIFSTWEFTSAPNFPNNIISWEKFGIIPAELEPNDYLLTWNKGVEAVRYCHYISPKEAEELCQKAHLRILKSYQTGSRGDEYNRYFITGV